jgi:4-amino-4-deoxychorismate lyase
MIALVDGHPCFHLALNDRGLLYGDGLFETIAVIDSYPRDLDRHLRRLLGGCERLAITPPDIALLKREVVQICAGANRAVLKIIVTRGQGGRGYRPVPQGHSTRILLLDEWPDYPHHYRDRGIAATCCRTRLARSVLLAGLKHLNRLEQVMARGEWQDEFQEALVLDTEGLLVEGTMSNVFVIQNDALHTPELRYAGVAGIMRERIVECAMAKGIPVHARAMTLADIESADALFFCNSLIGIWPAQRLNNRQFSDHRLTRALTELLDA